MTDKFQVLPVCDLLLKSDVLYLEELCVAAAMRVVEAVNRKTTVIVTDPGRSAASIFLTKLIV